MTQTKKRKGRPALYATPEEMQVKIDEYFEKCKGELARDKDGNPVLDRAGRPVILNQTPPTMAGLSYYLGFTNRKCFTQTKRTRPEFAETVLIARLRVEKAVEERLFNAETYAGAKFSLIRCFGWQMDEKEPPAPPIQIKEPRKQDKNTE